MFILAAQGPSQDDMNGNVIWPLGKSHVRGFRRRVELSHRFK